ncbi:trna splicing endonuclease subunit [Diaporthe amygdali]|uniref:trna splicing endonuclease subunit n=1 Tax=Phomopsis amygdali TaxID=1214568 RepID=UPI0022FDD2AC|nr:trna splicing endonuclease subunit [Diaporthe amygdali]KAJ0124661.1 trna splicing endonuclease subunit [Diaporthe amygdali]
MAFDDDDDDISTQRPAQSPEDAQATAEEALEDEAQDFRQFAALQRKKNISVSTIRKGEKDFESHGTKSQASALEKSRQAMEEVLSYTRVHNSKDWARAWYFPNRWVEDEVFEGNEVKTQKVAAERRELHAQERVVCVGFEHKTLGRKIRGQGNNKPGWDQVWLLPEEALFLIERGGLDLWWPTATMDEIFPLGSEGKGASATLEIEEEDEYALGFPLSLQAAYALLVGNEGERGKTSLRNLQVYSNLNRAGFNVIRVPPPTSDQNTAKAIAEDQSPLWQRLTALLFPDREPNHPAYGPLVRPGLYRSYGSIYKQIALVPRYKPTAHPPCSLSETQHSPFRVQFHVWKPSVQNWSKTKPPPPDYYLAVVDAHETSVPTSEEISALLDSVPHAPPPAPQRQGQAAFMMHRRLKHGHRNVLVAVNDHGVINYMRLGEGAFGEELLYKQYDVRTAPRGGKRGGGRGKGGRGGRGGGRGGRGGRGG